MKRIRWPFFRKHFYIRFIFSVFFLNLFLCTPLLAGFNLDYQTFRSNEAGREVVDVYFSVDNSQLVFVAKESIYEAQVEVMVYIKDLRGNLVEQKSSPYCFTCSEFADTRNVQKTNLFRFSFRLPAGSYNMVVHISDKNKKAVLKRAMTLRVPDYHGSKLQNSSLVLKTDGIARVYPLFDYHNPVIDVYFETYNAAGKILQNEIRFIRPNGAAVKSINGAVRCQSISEGFTARVSVFDLPPGKYTLQLIQTDGKDRAVSQKDVIIRQSPIDLRFKSFTQAVSELRYLTSEKELDKLARTNKAQQQEAINAFWESKDPTPGTAKNEALEEYYHRIEAANTLFSKNNTPGYLTDRGMVYILFGKPDVILRETSDGFHAHRQDWQYKKLRLSFVFIAWHWFEDYQLIDRSYVVANYLP